MMENLLPLQSFVTSQQEEDEATLVPLISLVMVSEARPETADLRWREIHVEEGSV